MSLADTLNRTSYQSPESANFDTPFSSRDALQTPVSSSEYTTPPVVIASPEAGNRMARLVVGQPAEIVPQSPEVAAHQARVEAEAKLADQTERYFQLVVEGYTDAEARLEIMRAGESVETVRQATLTAA